MDWGKEFKKINSKEIADAMKTIYEMVWAKAKRLEQNLNKE